MNKKKIINFILFPIKVLLDHNTVERIGLVSLRQERTNVCNKYVKGKVLDIGCGYNKFIQFYGNGVGMDINFYKGINILGAGEKLPFLQKVFDSITFNGSLRYIDNVVDALKESNRVLKDGGLILILENNPIQNFLRNITGWWTPFEKSKINGFTKEKMLSLLEESGFKFEKLVKYVYGFGRLYIGAKVKDCS